MCNTCKGKGIVTSKDGGLYTFLKCNDCDAAERNHQRFLQWHAEKLAEYEAEKGMAI